MRRERIAVARCTVEGLMRHFGLQGVRPGKVVRTTVSDAPADRPLDRSIGGCGKTAPISYGYRTSRMFSLGKAGTTWPS